MFGGAIYLALIPFQNFANVGKIMKIPLSKHYINEADLRPLPKKYLWVSLISATLLISGGILKIYDLLYKY